MRLKYIGKSDDVDLTNGKIYDCLGIEEYDGGAELIIIDDSEEDYYYDAVNPSSRELNSKGGRWEIVEDPDGKLAELFKKLKIS